MFSPEISFKTYVSNFLRFYPSQPLDCSEIIIIYNKTQQIKSRSKKMGKALAHIIFSKKHNYFVKDFYILMY